jgi:hypothetical protein
MVWWGYQIERVNLEDIGVDRRILLKGSSRSGKGRHERD